MQSVTQESYSGVFADPTFAPSSLAGVGEGLERVVDGREDEEEGLEFRDLEQLGNTTVDAGEDDLLAGFVPGDVGAHERPEAGGIDVGDLREVENERAGLFAADGVLQRMEIVGGEGAFEHENALADLGDCTLDDEGV